MPRSRRGLLLAVVACALAFGGCGGLTAEFTVPGQPVGDQAPPFIPGMEPVTRNERLLIPKSIEMGRVGEGANAVFVMRRVDAPPDQPLLIWIHGYGTASVGSQEQWLRHMTRRATVVFPVYTQFPFPVGPRFGQIAWPIVARALRRTLPKLQYDPQKVIVGGYSLGGALANDYAFNWRAEGLPLPYGLFSLFSGRRLERGDIYLPRQKGTLSPKTDVVQMASVNDLLAGTREASFMISKTPKSAPRRLIIVRNYAYGDHFAPTRTGREERERFWEPLDELIDRVNRRADRAAS
ncbi:MAG: alpha/beta hydrolase fold domain-containing protein [Solirubrobacteraceae bacterium]|nr:alpha/beta hydrolase fold domain-containing protein [Solirubrobacteraceae bacterium]